MGSRLPVHLVMAVWWVCVAALAADTSDMNKLELRSLLKDELKLRSGLCEDTSLYQDCFRVVSDNLCNTAVYYAHYCCRSCHTAGQVLHFGIYTAEEVKVPLVMELDREVMVMQRGDDVSLTCSASGYPTPEVGWISPNGATILRGTKYKIKVHYDDTPIVRTVQSTLMVRNFSHDDAGIYVCLAITPHDHTTATTTLTDPGRLQWVRSSRSQYVDVGEPMFLECVVKSAHPPTIVWKFNDSTIDEDSPFTVFVDSTGEDQNGLVTAYSSLRVNSSHTGYDGSYTCLARNVEATEEWKFSVSVMNVSHIAPNCTDVNREECYKAVLHCREKVLKQNCCRSCMLRWNYTGSSYLQLMQHVSKDMSPSVSIWVNHGADYLGRTTAVCFVKGIPSGLSFAWLKDTTTLQNSTKYTIEEMPYVPYFIRQLRLYINDLTLADAGNYTCTATAPASTPAALSMLLQFDSDARFTWKSI